MCGDSWWNNIPLHLVLSLELLLNQRVERLWRNVFRCVSVLFYEAFEDDYLLDPLNEVDLFCLRYVFLKRINAALKSFSESWNNHSISSAHSMTPNQLFIQGVLQQNMTTNLPTSPTSSAAFRRANTRW